MFYWESQSKGRIYWFSERHYKANLHMIAIQEKPREECFMSHTFPSCFQINQGVIVKSDYPTNNYINNFVDIIPDKATLYFSNFSKFPRTKIDLINAKRTTNPDKADIIVLDTFSEIQHIPIFYHVFYDLGHFYAIDNTSYHSYFNNDCTAFKEAPIGIKLTDPKTVYSGYVKAIYDPNLSISGFNKGTYNKPFIIDANLDKFICNKLPVPTLNELKSIMAMIYSNDLGNIKFGLQLLCTFNVCRIPLTIRTIIYGKPNWMEFTNAFLTNSTQMCRTLNIKNIGCGVQKNLLYIQEFNQTYSEEDISLAKEVAKYIPNLKDALKDYQPFFIDTLLFIPDEYKT